MADSSRGKVGIVVGGGPAPGINGVISSVTIEAVNRGLEVVGIQDGFKHLVAGDLAKTRPLRIADVAPHYYRGGSILGTARTNPAKNPADLQRVVDALHTLGVTHLVTIGGDDTAFSGSQVYKKAAGAIRVAHVPKTIDNDLPLPPGIPTFGFETARHYGFALARALHEDAKTTTRWYLIVSMGRAAGHLALGIGKASASTVVIISEEFRGKKVSFDRIADIIIGSMAKRKAQGKGYGLAVLAEGLIESIGEQGLVDAFGDELQRYGKLERDDHGHLRLGEIEFGRMVRDYVAKRLDGTGLKVSMIDKDLGYELRCADPIPFDAEYTRNLGYAAVKFLLSPDADQYGAIVSFVGGKMVPLKFEDMINPATGRMMPRLVDVESESYECARRYMIRLEKSDFTDPDQLAKLAKAAGMTPDQFRERFEYVAQ
jgi:ATP-dependent phosphofructokinase / diphosphate-dependent phosphofructokinase